MSSELAPTSWHLPPLDPVEYGPYGTFPRLSDAEKTALWAGYRAGDPSRVPVTLGMNNRVVLLDPRFNVDGLTFEQVFGDPEAMLRAQLRMAYLLRVRYHLFCDQHTAVPERWQVGVDFQNVYEAAALGAPVEFPANDVPATRPILGADNKRSVFDVDIDRPLELGIYRRGIEMTHRMRAIARGRAFFGRPIEVIPYVQLGSDGPLTVAMNLRGEAILVEVLREPEYVQQLLDFIVTAGIKRREAFLKYWGLPEPEEVCLADDSIATISAAQYKKSVLPHHRKWYDTIDPQHVKTRTMHLCGDATRHFATIRDELGVRSFDTGFPVDFAELRRELGPQAEILGGVEVPKLLNAAPEEVYRRTESILKAGILDGKRFVLRDANNLPPGVPWPNLAAMYQAAFDFGVYD